MDLYAIKFSILGFGCSQYKTKTGSSMLLNLVIFQFTSYVLILPLPNYCNLIRFCSIILLEACVYIIVCAVRL